MAAPELSPMTPERWIRNLLEVTAETADKQKQEARWLAPDAMVWERPERLLVELLDAYVFESFIKAFNSILNSEQQQAASRLFFEMDRFNEETPGNLDPAEVLADPRWHSIRARASEFVSAFQGWPSISLKAEAAVLLARNTDEYAARNERLAEEKSRS